MKRLIGFLTEQSGSLRRDLGILSLVFGILSFQMLWHFPLLEPDEGRYSEIPREMLERMDFITPTLNYVKYFEKPPLLYWLNSISFAIFGQNEFAARFPCALSGLLTILFTYWIGRELIGRRCGVLAAVIMGSSAGFIPLSKIILTDPPLTLFMTVSLGSFILALEDTKGRTSFYFYLSYASAGLAVLAKGLIGIVFPAAIVFLYILFKKRWRLLLEMRLFSGLILFLLVAAPWFVAVSLKNPEFARFFFIHEHFERFLTKVHSRYEPFWYFIPILAGLMLPWSLLTFHALRNAWRERTGPHASSILWLAIWAAFIFLFFSKSSSKLPPYILPVIPPLSILIAFWLDRTERLRPRAIIIASAVTIIVSIIGSTIVYSRLAESKSYKVTALKIKELAREDDIIATFGYVQTVPFYTERRTVVVGPMGELLFGSQIGDQSDWFIDAFAFSKLWESDRRVFLPISIEFMKNAEKTWKTPPRVIYSDNHTALLVNRP